MIIWLEQGQKESTIYLLQQYSIHFRQIGDVSKEKSTYTGSDADAHDRQLAVRILEHRLHKFPYVNVRDEIPERNVFIDQTTRVT